MRDVGSVGIISRVVLVSQSPSLALSLCRLLFARFEAVAATLGCNIRVPAVFLLWRLGKEANFEKSRDERYCSRCMGSWPFARHASVLYSIRLDIVSNGPRVLAYPYVACNVSCLAIGCSFVGTFNLIDNFKEGCIVI